MDTDYGQYFGRFQIIILQYSMTFSLYTSCTLLLIANTMFYFHFLGENLYSLEVHISHPHITMGFKEKSHQIDQVWQKLI